MDDFGGLKMMKKSNFLSNVSSETSMTTFVVGALKNEDVSWVDFSCK